jgi:beta-galactosidase
MKTLPKLIGFFLLLFGPFVLLAQPGVGITQKLQSDWRFILGDERALALSGALQQKGQPIQIPHDWSVLQPRDSSFASSQGFLPGGIGWYHRSLPQAKSDKRYYLYFEGVYNRSEVYINGELVGTRPNGYISFYYDVTAHLQSQPNNRLAVRVDHSRQADSRWYTGSGIYRPVYLIETGASHIVPHGLFTYADNVMDEPRLHVEVTMRNTQPIWVEHELRVHVKDPEGKVLIEKTVPVQLNALSDKTIKQVFEMTSPQLWGLTSQPLYTVHVELLDGAKSLSYSEVRTGFREFRFDPNEGFFLNGQPYKLKGVCIHHDAGVLGAAVPKEVWRRRLLKLKEMGVNAIRTSHNPQAPDLYDLCDELGLLVMNEAFDEWEFPKRKWLKGWNVGVPGFEGSYDFFEEWGEQDLEDFVKRDRNHVSIFAWSIGNEVDYPNDPYSHPVLDGDTANGFTQKTFGGFKPDAPDAMRLGHIAERLAAVVRKWDPTRAVTAGLAGVAMSNQTAYPAALDIAGYNYTESLYDQDHARYPDRVIYGSENRHGYADWKAVTSRDFIAGQFLWTGIDYLGESNPWPTRGFYSGLLDFSGNIKPRGYFRQSLWSEEPMAYLGTQRLRSERSSAQVSLDAPAFWNYEKGDRVRVYCYTNGDEAVLLLNNKIVGTRKAIDEQQGLIYWDLDFVSGQLEVQTFKAGKPWYKHSLATHAAPKNMQVLEMDEVISADFGTGHIGIGLFDRKGVFAGSAETKIHCEIVSGPITLLGLENANNRDTDDFTDAEHQSYLGKLMTYVQATGEKGVGVVRFTATGMKPLEVKIRVE